MKKKTPAKPKLGKEVEPLAQQLKAESRKMTGPRAAILAALKAQEHPLTIKEIFALLPEASGCDLATVYRSMHLLEDMRMVARYDFGDGSARFELIRHDHPHHHHHLICKECSLVVEIDDCFAEELEEKIARGNGFKAVSHKLEFFGICPACQKS
ncbi:MAG: Fur family transcriptional regulator [Verrucomicrobiales bacterium]